MDRVSLNTGAVALAVLALAVPESRGGICFCDLNDDCFVDGIDADIFYEAFEAGDMFADLNGDGFVNGIDYDSFFNHFDSYDPCDPPDFNGDGHVDGGDLCPFVQAYESGNVRADYNCDGVLDQTDLNSFMAEWRARVADWDEDGSVTCADLAAFCASYVQGNNDIAQCDINGDCFVDPIDLGAFNDVFDNASGSPGHLNCPSCP